MYFALALAIAMNFWTARHVPVPCTPVPVPGADARMPKDAFGFTAPMLAVGCQVLLSGEAVEVRKMSPPLYCADVVHEVGHVAGKHHTAAGIMGERVGLADVPYDCWHWRTFAERHGIPLRH